ncbi:MerR family transcriptional regulator, partial [bacterium]
MTPKGPSTLPAKLYFRIGEVADLVGVEPHVLRYWEREFRTIRPSKSAKGQRVYSRRDVENLFRVRELLYTQGFTIAGARKRLQKSGDEPESTSDVATAGAAAAGARFVGFGESEADTDVARSRASLPGHDGAEERTAAHGTHGTHGTNSAYGADAARGA